MNSVREVLVPRSMRIENTRISTLNRVLQAMLLSLTVYFVFLNPTHKESLSNIPAEVQLQTTLVPLILAAHSRSISMKARSLTNIRITLN